MFKRTFNDDGSLAYTLEEANGTFWFQEFSSDCTWAIMLGLLMTDRHCDCMENQCYFSQKGESTDLVHASARFLLDKTIPSWTTFNMIISIVRTPNDGDEDEATSHTVANDRIEA